MRAAFTWTFGRVALSPEARAQLEDVRHETAAHRVLPLACVLLTMHLVSVVVYGVFAPTPSPRHVRWAAQLTSIHAAYVVVAIALIVASARRLRFTGDAFAVVYVTYGALVSANTHLIRDNVEVFLAAVILVTVFIPLRTGVAATVLAGGVLLLFAGVRLVGAGSNAWLGIRGDALPTALVALAISRFQLRALAREIEQRRVIARQQRQLEQANEHLAAANRDLAVRVDNQSTALRSVALEADHLDRQLRARVRDRAEALRRAVAARDMDPFGADITPGTLLGDRFFVRSVLGRGGMGTVYRCEDRLIETDVALKTLITPRDPAAILRFMTEVQAMAAIRHPAVVRPLSVDVTDDGRAFVVQELVEGTTLSLWRARRRTLPVGHVLRLGATLADALAAAHRERVVHLDVKPSNVMLTTAAPGLKLLDFGIAWLRAGEGRPNVAAGTTVYMAPELLDGADAIGDRADVFALGVTLASLLTGPRSTRALDACGAPAELADLLARCAARAPSGRPTAGELALAFDELASRSGAPPLDELHRQALTASDAPTADGRQESIGTR
jgi:hypothetical protein